jgi:hypothetical protein
VKRHRPTLIYTGLAILATAIWTTLAAAVPVTGWWIAPGLAATFVVADRGEQAITRYLDRPKRIRRRTHAAPRPVKTERTHA